MTSPLCLGTRGSALAVTQAEIVAGLLRRAHPGLTVTVRRVTTRGDQDRASAVWDFGVRGVFVKELEEALLSGDIDVAVHSAKDLPSELPDNLVLAAVPERLDARDALVSLAGGALADLPPGARVGTGAPRREAQLGQARPDLRFLPVRGNVETRLGLRRRGDVEAVVLAMAGLLRLGRVDADVQPLPIDLCVPAPGQGALALEARASDRRTLALLEAVDQPLARAEVVAERAVVAALAAGCTVPLGVLARAAGTEIALVAAVGGPRGGGLIRETALGELTDPMGVGLRLADGLKRQGADERLRAARAALRGEDESPPTGD